MTPTSNATGFWSPSVWYCAEVLHILAGALILVAASLHGLTPWIVLACLLAGAAVKEFAIDLSPFEGDSLWGSAQDFFFYAIGGIGGFLAATSFFWSGGVVVIAGVLLCMVVDMYENACLKNSSGKWVPWREVI